METERRPDVSLTYGMFELGMSLAMLLTGIALVQLLNYLRNYSQDSLKFRLMVIGIFVIDTFHSALLLHTTYFYTIESFGDYVALGDLTWSLNLSVLMAGIIGLSVQGYYCFRVYRLTHSKIATACCGTLCIARFAFNIMETTTMMSSGKVHVVEGRTFRWQMTSVLVVGAVSDVLIATLVCGSLLRLRSVAGGGGFRATNRLVDRLVAFTIGSGLITSLAAISQATLYLTRDDFTFVVPYSIVAKLFVNSLLAALNEREANLLELASGGLAKRTDPFVHSKDLATQLSGKLPMRGSADTELDILQIDTKCEV